MGMEKNAEIKLESRMQQTHKILPLMYTRLPDAEQTTLKIHTFLSAGLVRKKVTFVIKVTKQL